MASAQIGSRRVDLEMFTGSFQDGAKNASKQLDTFSKKCGSGGAVITKAAASAASAAPASEARN